MGATAGSPASPTDPAADERRLMLGQVAVAHAITTDRALQDALRADAGGEADAPFAVQLPSAGAWLLVRGPGDFDIARERFAGVAALTSDAFYEAPAERQRLLAAAMKRTGAGIVASSRIDPMFRAGTLVRRDAHGWPAWSMLIEHAAYLAGSKLLRAVDSDRAYIGAALRAGRKLDPTDWRRHWDRIHAIANLTLLTFSAPSAPPWLAGLPHAFEWVRWSPSFPYVRERTVWLAAVGARSAALFGEAVIDRYFGLLKVAHHPVFALDRLFGLCAIGLAHPGSRKAILNELKIIGAAALPVTSNHADHVALAFRHAERLLGGEVRDGDSVLDEWLGWRGPPRGLATPAAMTGDPGAYSGPGEVLALAALPAMLAASIPDFYPARPLDPPSPTKIGRTLAERWSGTGDDLGRPTILH